MPVRSKVRTRRTVCPPSQAPGKTALHAPVRPPTEGGVTASPINTEHTGPIPALTATALRPRSSGSTAALISLPCLVTQTIPAPSQASRGRHVHREQSHATPHTDMGPVRRTPARHARAHPCTNESEPGSRGPPAPQLLSSKLHAACCCAGPRLPCNAFTQTNSGSFRDPGIWMRLKAALHRSRYTTEIQANRHIEAGKSVCVGHADAWRKHTLL